jgi:NAD-dependent dihydropyrimidine dehydrogenase PreA subunit
MMTEDVYLKLGERLNENYVKMILSEPFLKILREYYTEEQATLGASFPLGAHKAPDLAKQLSRNEKGLVDLLESMADKGLIFVSKIEDGLSEYSLTSFAPGVVDYQMMRGMDTAEDRKKAQMLGEFFKSMWGEGPVLEFMKDPEMLKQIMPDPFFRTITVEEALPSSVEIYEFEKLSELVDREESFAAAHCYCRHREYLLGNPCKVNGVPECSCLTFGKIADYVAARKFGKRITKRECMDILESTEEAGLVHNVSNFINKIAAVCNCCSCCCDGILKPVKKFENKAWLGYSNFGATIDEQSCSGCGDCLERCQMQALSLVEEVALINEDRCIGCGNCVAVCPEKSLSMKRRKHDRPPEVDPASIRGGV